jgi:hypothetical protein
LFTGFSPSAASGEPELGRDGGVDKSLEYFGDGFAN